MSSQSSYDTQAALNIMAQLQDPQWAQEAARIEESANCDIGAGSEWGSLLGQFMTNPQGFHQFQRLRSLVFKALKQLLADGNLGVGADAALAVGKEHLFLRLQNPTPDIQALLKSVLAEDLAQPGDAPLPDSAQARLQQAVCAALTPEDWEAIAIAAANAIQHHVTHHLSLPKSA